ncbi:MAG: aldo/keto reductase [Stomatobaculum sp.]|nr:aldo/keto reductase [Stomatobaculum sp.]
MNAFNMDIKKLGFGAMRFPKKGDEFDMDQIKKMVDRFLEEGFIYFDTAWAYPGSEKALKEALVDRYPREKFVLATKMAPWIGCETKEQAYAQFDTSLEATGAGYFDFFLLHNLGDFRTEFFDRFDCWNFVQEKKKEGLVKHVGFSFHDQPEVLDAILTAHPEMEFVQLQINYADWEVPEHRSRECYEVARKHGKPIVIMEPVKGGLLAAPPESVGKILKEADPEASYASWAIRFAASHEGVFVVLSGMSSLEQMEDNISFMKEFRPMNEGELETIRKAQDVLRSVPIIPCTSCNYCAKVCPMDIGISGSFVALNYYTLYNNLGMSLGRQSWLVDAHGKKRAGECIKCGACEQVCPQHIHIRDELEKVAATLQGDGKFNVRKG